MINPNRVETPSTSLHATANRRGLSTLLRSHPRKCSPRYSGDVFPDGSVSVGYYSPNYTREHKESHLYEEGRREQTFSIRDENGCVVWEGDCSHPGARDADLVTLSPKSSLVGLSIAPIPRMRIRSRKGLQGITRYGKRMIRSAAKLLEEKFRRSQLGFGTLTTPGLSRAQMAVVNRYWGELVKRFREELQREAERNGCKEFHFVSTTEIQEKRFRNYGDVGLHLHFLYVACDRRGRFYFSANKVREILSRILQNLLESYRQEWDVYGDSVVAAIDTRASVDLQLVKRSAARYLAKYLSKGGAILSQVVSEKRGCELPNQWWYVSPGLKKAVKAAVVKLSQEFCDAIIHHMDELKMAGVIAWGTLVLKHIEKYQEVYILGAIAFMSEKALKQIRETEWAIESG